MKPNKFQRFVGETTKWGILTLFAGIIAVLLIAALFNTCSVPQATEVIMYAKDFPLKHIITILFMLGAGVFFKREKAHNQFNEKLLSGIVFFVIILYAVFILSTQFELISDQKNCFDTATQFLNGNYTAWNPSGYAGRYPNQNGLILFFALTQFLFGVQNHLILQFINLASAVISVIFLTRIGELAFGLKNKLHTALLLLLYAPMMLYITFTYGTMIGLCLSVMGIYYQINFLKGGSRLNALASAICIPLAVFFKSNYLIVLVASVLVYIFYAIYKKKLLNVVAVIMLVCVYTFVNFGITTTIEKKIGTELPKGTPTIAWITMGVSESVKGPGWWSGYNTKLYVDSGFDSEKAHLQGVEDLKARVEYFKEDIPYTVNFFSKKLMSMWSEPSFQSLWIQIVKKHPFEVPKSISELFTPDSTINSLYYQIYDIFQTAVYFFTLVYLILNRKGLKIYQLLPAVIMIGGFFFHLIWEAKGQYSVVYFFLIIPYAISGFSGLTQFIHNKLTQFKEKKQKERTC